jgi:hypothetical protein
MITGCWTSKPANEPARLSNRAPTTTRASLPSPRGSEIGIFTVTDGFVPRDEIPMYLDPTFGWRLQLDCKPGEPISVREEFRLPGPGVWGAIPELEVRDNGRVAVSRSEAVCDNDGWIEKQWSVSPGDPPGEWVIRVTPEGYARTTFRAVFQETP